MIGSAGVRPSARQTGEPAAHVMYGIGAAASVAYAVWGSLLPFDFHGVPDAAAARFWRDWTAAAGPLSWSDLVSNVLLFLPIGLFFAAVAEKAWLGSRRRGLGVAVVMGAGAVLSGGIEFAQTFVSWRTPSKLDVMAEALGTAGGLVIWRYVSADLDALLRATAAIVRRSTRIERFLLVYCAAFIVAWWLPADFTLRPLEIADKYEHKRLLLPFTPSPDANTPIQLAVTAAAAVPLGMAALWCGCDQGTRRSAVKGALAAAVFLTALQIAQVPIFSRTTDGTALLAALAGSTAGALAARWLKRAEVAGLDLAPFRALAPATVWLAATTSLEWWPFHFVLDSDRVRFQQMAWSREPFRVPASVFDVLPGTMLAGAVGLLMRARLSGRFARLQGLLVVACAAGVFLGLELGRVLLASGRPTLVSVLVKEAAFIVGLLAGPARVEPAAGCASIQENNSG